MTSLRILPLLALLLLASRPDEGQWLPGQIREMDWSALRARGLRLDKDELWHPVRGGLVNAAVQLGGCSASFVSRDGLLLTNHHCAHAGINAISTLEKNYLKDGFHARSREQELPVDLEVTVVARIEDVTKRIHAVQARARSDAERYRLTQAEIERICDEGERDPETGKRDPRIDCTVAAFFEGREYLLYYRNVLRDVRLVYAPPADTARFGGDVDNWEWPRHSGDFTLLRAYVAPDGTPRDYDVENVPYHPKHWLSIAPHGIKEGDLVLIVGYPARTYRYLTSVAVQDEESYKYPMRQQVLEDILEVIDHAMESDPRKALELSSLRRSLANIEKNARGMILGLARNAVVDRKLREEEAFTRWVRRSADRMRRYGSVLQDLMDLDHEARTTLEKDTVLGFLTSGMVRELAPILDCMMTIVRAARGVKNGNAAADDETIARVTAAEVTKDLDLLQKPVLAILLEEVRNLPDDQCLQGSEVLPDSDVPAEEMVEGLFERTAMLDPEARLALLQGGAEAVRKSEDPLVVLARGLVAEEEAEQERDRVRMGRRMMVGQLWIEAQQAWRGKRFYPDANRTLRISIAEVKGYAPRDGVYYPPFTTVAGILEKNTGEEPFKVPDMLREAARRRGTSRFMNARIGDVPVCFLANGDTTAGNSGSPVLNGDGKLVGINFDRVFENVACDYGWDPDRSRNISLDIRFVLWHMANVMPAPRLLREMGVRAELR